MENRDVWLLGDSSSDRDPETLKAAVKRAVIRTLNGGSGTLDPIISGETRAKILDLRVEVQDMCNFLVDNERTLWSEVGKEGRHDTMEEKRKTVMSFVMQRARGPHYLQGV